MLRKSVTSSNIRSIGFLLTENQKTDKPCGTLEVEFANGVIWQYFDVPEEIAVSIHGATSPGSVFHRCVRGQFKDKLVVDPVASVAIDDSQSQSGSGQSISG
ncbi:MAG: KTSC domain-containing protein [Chthonomonadales bacterium]